MSDDPKSRTASTIRAAGHKASGGHSLLTPRAVGHRLHREPNDFSDHTKGRSRMTYVPYPKWLHFDGEPSVLVRDKDGEAEALAARDAPEKRGPGRPKKVVEAAVAPDALAPVAATPELPEKVFDLAPGDDPDGPTAEAVSES